MSQKQLLDKITKFYNRSSDFNGIPLDNLNPSEKILKELKELLIAGKIVFNFGDRHPNPHILAFEPESAKKQLAKLKKLNISKPTFEDLGSFKIQKGGTGCCIYPSKKHLRSLNIKKYKNKPYTALLTAGEPQLAYRVFGLRVLEFYRNDPRYSYEVDDISGSISVKGKSKLKKQEEAFIQTFGFAYDKKLKHRYVAVFIRYLSDLNSAHQQRWKLEEAKGKTFLHPDYSRATCGHFPERESVFTAFCEEIRVINEMTQKIYGKKIFKDDYGRDNRPKKFSFLIRPTKNEYLDFVQLLDKMMADNLNKDFFDGKIEMKTIKEVGNKIMEENKGTVTLLNEWLDQEIKFSDPGPKNEMIKTFRQVRTARSVPSHHLKEDEWANKFFSDQRTLIIKAYKAVRTLRLIFTNHPIAKSVEVPEDIFKGNIWNF